MWEMDLGQRRELWDPARIPLCYSDAAGLIHRTLTSITLFGAAIILMVNECGCLHRAMLTVHLPSANTTALNILQDKLAQIYTSLRKITVFSILATNISEPEDNLN